MRFAVLLSLVAVTAFAAPVGLGVGETKQVTVSQRVAHVEVSDGSRLEIAHKGATVTLTGKEPGRTTVHLVTVDGAEVSLDVHVVSPGARIFAVGDKGGAKAKPVAKSEKPAEKPAPSQAQAQDVP